MAKKVRGRPSAQSECSRNGRSRGESARNKLIVAARKCFASQSYAQVTTRRLAEEAGVNASLIRYYFLNKDGLYQQMLISVAEQFQNAVSRNIQQHPDKPFEALLRAHMSLASESPDIPRLVFRELAFDDGKGRQKMIEHVARPNRAFLMTLSEKLQSNGQLKADFDPMVLMLAVMSISIVPHLLRDALSLADGHNMTEQEIEKTIWQNAHMIQYGCLRGNTSE